MNKKDKALEYFDYLVKMNPNKTVKLKFFIRVYDDNSVEASYQPFILDKECIYSVVEYVIMYRSGFNTKFDNIQLYFNSDGETFDYAPYNGGMLKIDTRQAQAGYEGGGYYDCSYSRNGLTLTYNGYPSIDYLPFYALFLSYAKMVEACTNQSEVDYIEKCLKKDIEIEELKKIDIAKEARISRLEDLLEAHKDLIVEIKKLIG
jgi:hypothetical protein